MITLSAKIEKTQVFEIVELFRLNNRYIRLFDSQYIEIKDCTLEELDSLWLEPTISRQKLTQAFTNYLWENQDSIQPITEDQFQDAIHRTFNTIISE